MTLTNLIAAARSRNPNAGEAARKMLAAVTADYSREKAFRLVAIELARQLGFAEGAVRRLAQELVRSGALERISNGFYRVTGKPHAHVRRPDYASDPTRVAGYVSNARKHPVVAKPPAPCSYATARACGIEPVVVIRPWVTEGGIYARAITLARVPCLEKRLPREVA